MLATKKPILPENFIGGQSLHNVLILVGVGIVLYKVVCIESEIAKMQYAEQTDSE